MRVWPDHPDELRLDETLTTPVTLLALLSLVMTCCGGTVNMSWRKCHLTRKLEMNKWRRAGVDVTQHMKLNELAWMSLNT